MNMCNGYALHSPWPHLQSLCSGLGPHSRETAGLITDGHRAAFVEQVQCACTGWPPVPGRLCEGFTEGVCATIQHQPHQLLPHLEGRSLVLLEGWSLPASSMGGLGMRGSAAATAAKPCSAFAATGQSAWGTSVPSPHSFGFTTRPRLLVKLPVEAGVTGVSTSVIERLRCILTGPRVPCTPAQRASELRGCSTLQL